MSGSERFSSTRAGAVAVLLFAGGCAPADRWSPFDVYGPAPAVPRIEDVRLAEEDASIQPLDVPLELTVERAALLALQNNRDLRVQRYTPMITATFEELERGAFDPEVFAGAEVFKEESEEISRATSENFSVTRDELNVGGGVRQTLPSGTNVELNAGTTLNTSNRAPDQQDLRVGLTVTQALLRGFGPAVNLARVRQAELETVASQYELQGFTEAVLAETEATYWQFALATRRLEIFDESLGLARRQQEEVTERIDVGVLAPTEAAAARAEVAQREQDLIDARSAMQQFRLQLLRLINPRDEGLFTLEIAAVTNPVTSSLEPIRDLDDRVELARRHRPDVNEARLRLEQQRLETVVTRNGVLPRLDLFVALGKTGFADSFGPAVRQLDGPTYDVTAGLEFSMWLGNRTAEARHDAALFSRRQAAEAVANIEQLARLDVRLAATEVERAREQIGASAATRHLREEALRAEEERFRVGDSTSLLVAQAQRDLLESQIAEVESVVEYRLALIELYLAEGSLLSRRGIVVGGER